MTRTALACTALAALLCGACADAGVASSTIALRDGRVVVTSPDDDAVVYLDPASLEEVARVAVAGAPEQLLDVGGQLFVSLAQDAAVARVDDGGRVARLQVPCGGTYALAFRETPEPWLFVSCPLDDRVLVLTPGGDVHAVLRVAGGPRALAFDGDRLVVAASRSGELVRIPLAALADEAARERVPLSPEPGLAAAQLRSAATLPGRAPVFAYQLVDHDSDRERAPEAGGYGAVRDGAPRIQPALAGACAGTYAVFDGGARVFSGPSAAAWAPAPGVLWVAHQYTDNVAALRCGDDGLELFASFSTGRGPRGLALTDDGREAFVDLGFAHAVARLALPDAPTGDVVPAEQTVRREVGDTRLSERALAGRSLFHDAVNTHLTPSGVVTCATCHPDGGADGLRWFLHTTGVPRKLRRTPPAWGARASLAPFHWDGEFDDGATLAEGTIRELMEGDALLVDTGAIAAYMAELPPPRRRPPENEDAAARGRAWFEAAEVGCTECHSGRLYTGEGAHAVVPPSADPDGVLDAATVPSLVGVRGRAPYLHDGRAPDLFSLFREHNPLDAHGATSALDDAQLMDLVAFLESL